MSRRDLIRQALTVGAVAAGARVAGAQEVGTSAQQGGTAGVPRPALREIGKQRNLLVGTAVSYAQLQRPDFTKLLAEQAAIVVAENEMKWQRIHPEPERYEFARGDALVAFAAQHDQLVRGHNLCWHQQLPAWFSQVATSQNAARLLREHIAAVAGHFAGHIHSWDVVNEAVHVEDGRPDGLRNSAWLRLIGPEYIDIAFRGASEADPKALLTYNDYDLEQDSPAHEAKRMAVIGMLTGMRRRKVPLHALGLQSHLKAGTGAAQWSGFDRFLAQVRELDLEIFVTELDVDDSALPGDVAERDRGVADLYRGYLRNVLADRRVKTVLTWGLSDRDTWLNHFKPRADGEPQRPLPFDPELKPTPVFFAMRDAISAAPGR